jgi:hypothetical protein
VTDAARVGVPAMQVPPPPRSVGRLPNLTADERKVESAFAERYERDPDGMAGLFRDETVQRAARKGEPPTFSTDEAKELSTAPAPPSRRGLRLRKVSRRGSLLVKWACVRNPRRRFLELNSGGAGQHSLIWGASHS